MAVLSAVPITATEAAWVRLKGAEAMREAWVQDGVDTDGPTAASRQPSLSGEPPIRDMAFRRAPLAA